MIRSGFLIDGTGTSGSATDALEPEVVNYRFGAASSAKHRLLNARKESTWRPRDPWSSLVGLSQISIKLKSLSNSVIEPQGSQRSQSKNSRGVRSRFTCR